MNEWFLNGALNSAVSWNLTPPTSEPIVGSAESRMMTDLPPGAAPCQFPLAGHHHNLTPFVAMGAAAAIHSLALSRPPDFWGPMSPPAPPPSPSGLKRDMSCLSSKAIPILDFPLISWDPCMGCFIEQAFIETVPCKVLWKNTKIKTISGHFLLEVWN